MLPPVENELFTIFAPQSVPRAMEVSQFENVLHDMTRYLSESASIQVESGLESDMFWRMIPVAAAAVPRSSILPDELILESVTYDTLPLSVIVTQEIQLMIGLLVPSHVPKIL